MLAPKFQWLNFDCVVVFAAGWKDSMVACVPLACREQSTEKRGRDKQSGSNKKKVGALMLSFLCKVSLAVLGVECARVSHSACTHPRTRYMDAPASLRVQVLCPARLNCFGCGTLYTSVRRYIFGGMKTNTQNPQGVTH